MQSDRELLEEILRRLCKIEAELDCVPEVKVLRERAVSYAAYCAQEADALKRGVPVPA